MNCIIGSKVYHKDKDQCQTDGQLAGDPRIANKEEQ